MKTIKSIFLAVLILVGTTVSASENPSPEKTNLEKASEEIALLLRTPYFNVEEDLTAQVSLMVNEENEIVVMSVRTESNDLEQFVKSRLNYQKLNQSLDAGLVYTLPVKVKSES